MLFVIILKILIMCLLHVHRLIWKRLADLINVHFLSQKLVIFGWSLQIWRSWIKWMYFVFYLGQFTGLFSKKKPNFNKKTKKKTKTRSSAATLLSHCCIFWMDELYFCWMSFLTPDCTNFNGASCNGGLFFLRVN